MKFTAIKKNGHLTFPPAIAEERRRYIERLREGAVVSEDLSHYRAPKSQKQLGAHFGLMLAMAVIELNDRGYDTSFLLRIDKPTGIGITRDMLKEYLYSVCPIFNNEGAKITLSNATTEQAAKHFEDCRNFLASQWQINVPKPDINWRKKNGKN